MQVKKEWRWVNGRPRWISLPPETVGEGLDKIREARGKLDDETLVEEARHPANVFHDHFDWDDARVAHRARCRRAGEIISSVTMVEVPVTVTVETVTVGPKPTPAAEFKTPSGSGKYPGPYYRHVPGVGTVPAEGLTEAQKSARDDADRRWAAGQLRGILGRVGYLRNRGYAEAVQHVELAAEALEKSADTADAAE